MKRKLLFIIFAFMFVLLIFCNNSFANSEVLFSDGNTYTIPDFTLDDNSNYIIARKSTGAISVYMYNKQYKLIKNQQGTSYYFNLYDTDNNMLSGTNIHSLEYNSGLNLSDDGYTGGIAFREDYTYHSNVNIYDTSGILVFQGPVQEMTLAQVLETEKQKNPQMVMKEILIILPMTLVVVVSYLGLRKALAMLSAILHRS